MFKKIKHEIIHWLYKFSLIYQKNHLTFNSEKRLVNIARRRECSVGLSILLVYELDHLGGGADFQTCLFECCSFCHIFLTSAVDNYYSLFLPGEANSVSQFCAKINLLHSSYISFPSLLSCLHLSRLDSLPWIIYVHLLRKRIVSWDRVGSCRWYDWIEDWTEPLIIRNFSVAPNKDLFI